MIHRRALLAGSFAFMSCAQAPAPQGAPMLEVNSDPPLPPEAAAANAPVWAAGERRWGASSRYGLGWAGVSPDGRTSAAVETYGGLTLRPLLAKPAEAPQRGSAPAITQRFGMRSIVNFQELGFRFSTSNDFVWGVWSKTVGGGFPTGEAFPVRMREGLDFDTLPTLRVEGGPLDDISWADGEGVGVGHFGTLGDHRRPEIASPDPTLAVVDVVRGAIRAPISMLREVAAPLGHPRGLAHLRLHACDRLRDGRVRFLSEVIVYTEPKDPRVIRVMEWIEGQGPVFHEDPMLRDKRIALVPDQRRLLVYFRLMPAGNFIICDPFPCPELNTRIPVSGPAYGLYDMQASRWIWIRTARATKEYAHGAGPVVSPDGRLGLVALPELAGAYTSVIAVIDLRDGKVLKRILAPGQNWVGGFIGNQAYVGERGLYVFHDV